MWRPEFWCPDWMTEAYARGGEGYALVYPSQKECAVLRGTEANPFVFVGPVLLKTPDGRRFNVIGREVT